MEETKDAFTRSPMTRRRFLTTTALAGVGVAAGGSVLAACGGGSSGGGAGGGGKKTGSVTWASWANPGEAERFKAYSKDYAKKTGNKITYQTVVGDYKTKLMTQLQGNSAPDAFYVGDDTIAALIKAKQVVKLDDFLASPDATVNLDDMYTKLLEWCKGPDGGVYGLTVDCNPKLFWFNRKVLQAAGVDGDPAAWYEAGTWNQDAITKMLEKVKGSGKRGYVFEGNWFELFSWISTFGGKTFDDQGNPQFADDSKAQDIITWLFDMMSKDYMSYGGSLPKGQGVDALFYAGQSSAIGYGRWILPNLKKLKKTVDYDIAPLPSESGKDVMPVGVYTACMSVNPKAKNMDVTLKFASDFVNKDGQQYRLSGGGNAVPTIKGLESLVTEGNDPAHGKFFSEVAAKGFAVPKLIVSNPEVATKFSLDIDKMLKSKKETPKSFSDKLTAILTGGGS
ncbi:multiple sugar transport system substrate-binding protein [Microlunatus panaciterrae]|uniref:Multiple sugar transport system substrate-binding protein n=1 Tax=Microlunatus panaciterrae TaxID=400768 RepID=A0ABS2RN02_9ACTN|nr:sugar ABC transporter substrate-binding protein [Microlunatus panaciterrae]MBM7800396.1 multiple sugar transport system substrate-binding protein [Microlunatus panaciterrae]